MDPFDYFFGFYSIVLGLSVVELLVALTFARPSHPPGSFTISEA